MVDIARGQGLKSPVESKKSGKAFNISDPMGEVARGLWRAPHSDWLVPAIKGEVEIRKPACEGMNTKVVYDDIVTYFPSSWIGAGGIQHD
jgi:hypothetical protein